MNGNQTLISTSQAASLLQVHESSIKRWCNADALHCEYTAGRHRRIPLWALLEFAREQEMACSLLDFAPNEEKVWRAFEKARSNKGFDDIVLIAYDWVREGDEVALSKLIHFLQGWNFPVSRIFDRLIGAIMYNVGDAWVSGRIGTGDEHRMTELVRDTINAIRLDLMRKREKPPEGRIAVVGCAAGELHELGALMVRVILEEAGWRVVYLGANVPAEDLAAQQAKFDAKLLAVSIMPPRGEADARNLVRLLARFYNPEEPYHLAIGGSGLDDTRSLMPSTEPFEDVKMFREIEVFSDWVATRSVAEAAPVYTNGRN